MNLVLKHEVFKAAELGLFHIYAVKRVGGGVMELRTDRHTGVINAEGIYPRGVQTTSSCFISDQETTR
ncbi:MAG: hypothetical protein ABW148_16555 [Sedimenticola sp.]